MRKRLFALLLAVLLLVTENAFSSAVYAVGEVNYEKRIEITEDENYDMGNLIAEDKSWIFYTDIEKECLCAENKSSGQVIVLTDFPAANLNVYNDTLFFTDLYGTLTYDTDNGMSTEEANVGGNLYRIRNLSGIANAATVEKIGGSDNCYYDLKYDDNGFYGMMIEPDGYTGYVKLNDTGDAIGYLGTEPGETITNTIEKNGWLYLEIITDESESGIYSGYILCIDRDGGSGRKTMVYGMNMHLVSGRIVFQSTSDYYLYAIEPGTDSAYVISYFPVSNFYMYGGFIMCKGYSPYAEVNMVISKDEWITPFETTWFTAVNDWKNMLDVCCVPMVAARNRTNKIRFDREDEIVEPDPPTGGGIFRPGQGIDDYDGQDYPGPILDGGITGTENGGIGTGRMGGLGPGPIGGTGTGTNNGGTGNNSVGGDKSGGDKNGGTDNTGTDNTGTGNTGTGNSDKKPAKNTDDDYLPILYDVNSDIRTGTTDIETDEKGPVLFPGQDKLAKETGAAEKVEDNGPIARRIRGRQSQSSNDTVASADKGTDKNSDINSGDSGKDSDKDKDKEQQKQEEEKNKKPDPQLAVAEAYDIWQYILNWGKDFSGCTYNTTPEQQANFRCYYEDNGAGLAKGLQDEIDSVDAQVAGYGLSKDQIDGIKKVITDAMNQVLQNACYQVNLKEVSDDGMSAIVTISMESHMHLPDENDLLKKLSGNSWRSAAGISSGDSTATMMYKALVYVFQGVTWTAPEHRSCDIRVDYIKSEEHWRINDPKAIADMLIDEKFTAKSVSLDGSSSSGKGNDNDWFDREPVPEPIKKREEPLDGHIFVKHRNMANRRNFVGPEKYDYAYTSLLRKYSRDQIKEMLSVDTGFQGALYLMTPKDREILRYNLAAIRDRYKDSIKTMDKSDYSAAEYKERQESFKRQIDALDYVIGCIEDYDPKGLFGKMRAGWRSLFDNKPYGQKWADTRLVTQIAGDYFVNGLYETWKDLSD